MFKVSMKDSRLKNSIRNILTAWLSQVIKIVFAFVGRYVFITQLSAEYLGINGLFSSILMALTFVELGMGSAIMYSLYRPIAEENQDELWALIKLFRKIFISIGIFVLLAGSLISPFLDVFIKEMPDIRHIQLIYLMFVINTSITYIFTYKGTILTAYQKNYILKIIRTSSFVALTIVQILILIVTKNYILFLTVQIVFTVIEGMLLSYVFNKVIGKIPRKSVEVSKDVKANIILNTKAIAYFKVGHVINNTVDNFMISKLIGIVSVGIYSNYYMIITAVDSVIAQFFAAITASIGNMRVTTKHEKQETVFNATMLISHFGYSASAMCLLAVTNTFIEYFYTEDYLFEMTVLFVLVINFYLQGLRKPFSIFREAFGLYKHTKYVSIIEAGMNLYFSVIFIKYWGIAGVFMATILSYLICGFWFEPYILFKYGFEKKVLIYWKKYISFVLVGILQIATVTYLLRLNSSISIWAMIVNVIICGILSIVCNVVVFSKSDELKYVINIVIGKISKR